jgi:HlyD family secretion protein
MRKLAWLVVAAGLMLAWAASNGPDGRPVPNVRAEASDADTPPPLNAEVPGKTQPVPGKAALIAPVPLHPVEEVKVVPGDRVKKDQPLVLIDADEPKADVRAKEAALKELKAGLEKLKAQPREEERAEARAMLESVRVSVKEYREHVERLEKARDSLSEVSLRTIRSALMRHEADERANVARLERLLKLPIEQEIAEMEAKVAGAQAALESAQFELEHYTVTAMIDGVVSWLDVRPGMVSRPGTTVWGEILDLSEIDVRCELTADQADRVSVGQPAEVRRDGRKDVWAGKVVFVGLAADPKTGKVPASIRIKDAQERLRCYIDVLVRFK